MHYPWWYVPGLTAPMLIAAIAVVHVIVSHYAVGGGIFLAVETRHAYRTNNREYLGYLKKHAQFFVLLTVVFGAITGVGIWWTIGLASPLATEMLIRTFVFGWAWEYVFFVVEIAAAFIFFYAWGRLPPRTHVTIGWIYAAAAWISLFLITGITGFMLNPGGWIESQSFWSGFFNPQLLPQVVARTGGALLLTSLYVYLHAAIVIKDEAMQRLIEKRSTRPALLGAILITVGGVLWYVSLPQSAVAVLFSASVLNVLMALIFAATAIVFVLLYLGPYRNPGWLHSPGFAAALFAFGLIAFTTGEFIREAVRKPYIVYRVIYGNQVLAKDEVIERSRQQGYLESGPWPKAYVAEHYPQVLTADGHIDNAQLLQLQRNDQLTLGGVIFQYHCNNCHALDVGYSAATPLMQGWSPHMIRDFIPKMDIVRTAMPPWCGTPEEVELLARYLESETPPRPEGLDPGSGPIVDGVRLLSNSLGGAEKNSPPSDDPAAATPRTEAQR